MTLSKKLGLKSGMAVLVAHAPGSFAPLLEDRPGGIRFVSGKARGVDAVIAFVRQQADVPSAFQSARAALKEDGLLWFAYPKKTGGIKSDLARDQGWEPLREAGYDSVAQVAIDADWTGFRFRDQS